MPLNIETFSNIYGGNAFFKAISHPLIAPRVAALFAEIQAAGRVVVYDPLSKAEAFAQYYDIKALPIAGYFVQDVEQLGKTFARHAAALVSDIGKAVDAGSVLLVTSFDAGRMLDHIRHLLPANLTIRSFDDLRLPGSMQSDKTRYLTPLNFATNFVFFRDEAGLHTRLVTANYWSGYGATDVQLWCQLFAADGTVLATWQQAVAGGQSTFTLDSAEVRARFNLPAFTGQLFIHACGIAGHDVIKYALDTYGDAAETLSCTHDANSWPADYYAGLPAPDSGEQVILWLQNSQPFAVPANEIGLNVMGDANAVFWQHPIPPFATVALDVKSLLPNAAWPQQLELTAGKYLTRPRYEVITAEQRRRIAHMNVERIDLKPDAKLPQHSPLFGKGHILPAPLLPLPRYQTLLLPTPMARGQQHLPVAALIYDANGGEAIARHAFGNLPRNHQQVLDVGALLAAQGKTLPSGHGHIELVYDFAVGQEADGWLHGLFRYTDNLSGHAADSSFGSHIFNTIITYKNEPQSYAGRAPGLSTRLFLRVGDQPYKTFCHLVYPASTLWHAYSATTLTLHASNGQPVATAQLQIPCSGSCHWRVDEVFSAAQLAAAGNGATIIIRDTTCRLFGYHGLVLGETAFSLDHMFGF